MEQSSVGRTPAFKAEEDISVGMFVALVLHWRRVIAVLAFLGAGIVFTVSFLSRRQYESIASFIPQGSESAAAGLSLAAGQFGLRLASPTGVWGPGVYVHLLKTQALLTPIALDTVTVSAGAKPLPVMDLLNVPLYPPPRRLEETIGRLRKMVEVTDVKSINAVRISVKTPWPAFTLRVAERLLQGANQFNLDTRKASATVERQFVEGQAAEAALALRVAERALEVFLIKNRSVVNSPELAFERDRLQRDVGMRQSIYVGLLSSREEARIREFRDTPVISVIESPLLPISGVARKSIQKGILGGVAGAALGVLIAMLAQWLAAMRQSRNPAIQEMLRFVDNAAVWRRLLRKKEQVR